MTNLQDYLNLPLVDAIIGGNVSAKEAGFATPPIVQAIFGLAEKLGELSRGTAVAFDPDEAGQLHGIIDHATSLILAGKIPSTAFDKIARRFMDLAFAVKDPMSWAFELSDTRDGTEPWLAAPADAQSQT